MSTTVDQRVVEMRFDNKQFEQNVSTTMSTLGKLKQSLNLTGATKGLENVSEAAKGINLSGLSTAADTVAVKFSYMQASIQHQLNRIVDGAVTAGKRIVSALTIDPIKTGFAEYETQINAVQTILANTQSKGKTIEDVNSALDELNTYADKTIYNFTEMTRNIGTFTAAGVDLDKSVTSIKGIANLAAVSGSTSQQASTAMYQLSQALAAGKVSLMDWNSVVNAGMGGQVFQDALKRTATHMGKDVDGMIKKYGSFRESLTQGEWLTADVLTETLTQLSGAYSEADLIAQGYTESQAKEITELADTAVNAATKVKTFTQLWDTLKESAQSGWTQSWEIIVGDFEEAKELLTKVSDTIGEMINASSESRNNLLQGWKDAGGRNELIKGIANVFNGLMNIAKPIKEAFRDIFPPMTVDNLLNFTDNFVKLTEKFKEFGTKYADQIKSTFKGIFSIVDIGKKIFTAFGTSISKLLGSSGVSSVGDFVMNTVASIGDFFTNLNENFDVKGVSGIFSSIASGISSALGKSVDILKGFGSALTTIGDVISKVASSIWNGVKTVFGWISENFSMGDVFAGLAGGGIFVLAKKLIGFVDGIKESFDGLFGKGEGGGGITEKFSELLDGVHESLASFSTGIKVGSFVAIAASIAILASAFGKISELDSNGIVKSLVTMGASLGIMMKTLNSMPMDTTGLIKSGIALILIAKSIDILSESILKMSGLSWEEIGKGLAGVGGGIVVLCGGLKILNGTKVSLGTSIAMLALAESCKILGDAMQKFVGFSWDEIGRGLAGMGGALAEMVASLSILSKVGGFSALLGGTAILIAVQSLSDLAEGLKSFGGMSWDEIGRGLVGMGGALVEVAGITGVLGKVAGFSSIFASGAILMVVQGLGDLSTAFQSFGGMSWDEIGRGLVAMGGALAEVAVITGALGMLAGFSGLLGGGAILLAVQSLSDLAVAFQSFGGMSWDEIGRGLVAMGGALAEVAVITGALGVLAGFSGLLGGGAILLAVQSLSDLAAAFQSFGGMSWDEIGIGLVAMGGALAEVAVITGALGALAGLPALLGGGAILLAVQGLGELADALKKFGDMSWDEIGKGLTAMGAALGEVALGGLLNTLSGFGAGAIAEVAAPLGTLADSVKKWSGVTVSEDLSTNLKSLASGVKAFTFGGLGAGALTEAAPGIGIMADSVKKWSGVTVPENLGSNLETLAGGVKAFTFGGLGSSALEEAAPGLGTMADSVTKWSGVTVPENIGTSLSSLAVGVNSFTFGGSGASSLTEAAPGVGTMADSVKKWSGVTVPEDLGTNLSTLATGVKAFTFGGSGADSIATCASGLGVMADSVKKWTGLTLPENLSTNMSSLATAVKSFTWGGGAADTLSVAATGVGTMADSVKKWVGVTIPEGFSESLSGLATVVKDIAGVGDVSATATSLSSLAASANELAGVGYDAIKNGLANLATAITDLSSASSSVSGLGNKIYNELIAPLKNSSVDVSSVGTKIVDSIATGAKNGQANLTATMNSVVTTAADAIGGVSGKFKTTGETLANKLIEGIKSKQNGVTEASKTVSSKAASGAKDNYSSMVSAGVYLGQGFVIGIKSMEEAAYNAGYDLGEAANRGEADANDRQSPAKEMVKAGKFFGGGFVIGINSMGKAVYEAGSAMGKKGFTAVSDSISKITDAIDADIDAQPTIRPVLDLSDIRAGASSIGGLLGVNSSLTANIGSISTMMSRRGQNGVENEVVSAINKLRRDFASMPRESYNINGVTYDDGSNIKSFAQAVVHQARLERRV